VNFNHPPAQVIDQLYRGHLNRDYKKVTHGAQLFRKLDPKDAYVCCPAFAGMMDALLTLCRQAGL